MRNSSVAIAWYYPNIIGYVRVALVIACLFISVTQPIILVSLLIIAGLLDNLDGYVARCFQQSSRFGAVLDYVTDRITTVVYVKILADILPDYASIFYLLFMIDMASHMARLYVAMWADGNHHKEIVSEFKLLNMYYPKKSVSAMMGFCTHSYELFFIVLILLYAGGEPVTSVWVLWTVLLVSLPGFITKNVVHVLQLVECFRSAILME